MNLRATILIQADEGELGTFKPYTGMRTVEAIKRTLEVKRRNGARWAKAWVNIHSGIYCNFEQPEDLREIPSPLTGSLPTS